MIRSMTAYARETLKIGNQHFSIEISSLNRKNLDIHVSVPKEMLFLDSPIRKLLTQFVKRGVVQVRVAYLPQENIGATLISDELLLDVKNQWEEKKKHLGIEQNLSIEFLVDQCHKFAHEQSFHLEEKEIDQLLSQLDETAKKWIEMKEKEGKALVDDITPRMNLILEKIDEISALSYDAVSRYETKIKDKIKSLMQDLPLDEERVAKEVLLYADKIDITEEIVRIHSHANQFIQHLNLHEISIGKTLDFLLQEMHREINSLGVKSQDLQISKYVIEIKSELEKVREQVQNIE